MQRAAVDQLRAIPVYRRLSDDDLDMLAAVASSRLYQKGERVFSEGDPGDRFHVIVRGRVKVQRTTPAGKDLILALLGPATRWGRWRSIVEDAPFDPDAARVVPVDNDLLALGYEIYVRNCAPFHGERGQGDGPASATLDPKPRDHTLREYMDTLTDARLADTIRMGGAAFGYPNMPSNPHLGGDDLAAVIDYVRSLSRGADGVMTVEVAAKY